MTLSAPKSLALLLLAALLGGCLEARESDRLTYDATRDEFRFVMVLENISGDTSDLQYLNAILRNKDHLLAPVVATNPFGMMPWFVRLDDHMAGKLTFQQPKPGDMQPITVKETSLASIEIKPGALFVQNNMLCYYHAMNVPGKAIDSVMTQMRGDELKSVKKAVQAERDRRKNHGKVHTWDELMKQEVEALEKDSADHPIKPFEVMEDASLEHIVTVTAEGQKGMTRQGKDFVLNMPLTERDRDGVLRLWDTWMKAADKQAAQKPSNPMLAVQRLPLQSARVERTEEGVKFSFDFVKMYNSFEETARSYLDERSAPPKPPVEPTSEVNYARNHGWPLEDGITKAQVLQDFAAGTLKSYPSESVLKPGTYLKVQPK